MAEKSEIKIDGKLNFKSDQKGSNEVLKTLKGTAGGVDGLIGKLKTLNTLAIQVKNNLASIGRGMGFGGGGGGGGNGGFGANPLLGPGGGGGMVRASNATLNMSNGGGGNWGYNGGGGGPFGGRGGGGGGNGGGNNNGGGGGSGVNWGRGLPQIGATAGQFIKGGFSSIDAWQMQESRLQSDLGLRDKFALEKMNRNFTSQAALGIIMNNNSLRDSYVNVGLRAVRNGDTMATAGAGIAQQVLAASMMGSGAAAVSRGALLSGGATAGAGFSLWNPTQAAESVGLLRDDRSAMYSEGQKLKLQTEMIENIKHAHPELMDAVTNYGNTLDQRMGADRVLFGSMGAKYRDGSRMHSAIGRYADNFALATISRPDLMTKDGKHLFTENQGMGAMLGAAQYTSSANARSIGSDILKVQMTGIAPQAATLLASAMANSNAKSVSAIANQIFAGVRNGQLSPASGNMVSQYSYDNNFSSNAGFMGNSYFKPLTVRGGGNNTDMMRNNMAALSAFGGLNSYDQSNKARGAVFNQRILDKMHISSPTLAMAMYRMRNDRSLPDIVTKWNSNHNYVPWQLSAFIPANSNKERTNIGQQLMKNLIEGGDITTSGSLLSRSPGGPENSLWAQASQRLGSSPSPKQVDALNRKYNNAVAAAHWLFEGQDAEHPKSYLPQVAGRGGFGLKKGQKLSDLPADVTQPRDQDKLGGSIDEALMNTKKSFKLLDDGIDGTILKLNDFGTDLKSVIQTANKLWKLANSPTFSRSLYDIDDAPHKTPGSK